MTWHEQHRTIQDQFLRFIGGDSGLVLKGGTALMKCYGLDRFSEDLDFDAMWTGVSTIRRVQKFCATYGYEISIRKDSPFVQRVMVHYGNPSHPLKIETSSRDIPIDNNLVTIINDIQVYTLDWLAVLKANAFLSRDTIRDLYDVSFLVHHYYEDLSLIPRQQLRAAFAVKGLEQFDVVLATNDDELIDSDKLIESCLLAHEKLGITTSDEEKNLSAHIQLWHELNEGKHQVSPKHSPRHSR
ncbi:nucleotidyl transferase AbiEii/AbiGii toxin family protein [Trueperella sp. LYQ143]|uniref:nucleotidyl transferase AbiEii/AbiGii toxin family protein n=1 Tax=Trueperella sp. LYQ143 TaxID=3391059 RepID=UPI0039839686